MGEVLLRLSAPDSKRISECGSFRCDVGGSELNIAAGAAQLGLNSALITRLPYNDIGRMALYALKSAGVSDKLLSFDNSKSARLGLYFFESGVSPKKPKVVYDRANSSISSLTLSDIPETVYSQTRVFHTSGITLALDGVRNTAIEAIRRFKQGGALISLDVNYRAALWDEATAREVITGVLPLIDILFVSEETSRRMLGKTGTLEEIMRSYHTQYGTQLVATTARRVISPAEHSWSSKIYVAATDSFYTEAAYEHISVIDRIGSGDAYVAGALYGLLEKGKPQDIVSFGNAMTVLKCTINGDLPLISIDDVNILIAQRENGDVSEMNR
nr:sugar kinase [Acetanaerobacterium elongatum]